MVEGNSDSININKFISQTGICSRREADKWIEQGRVKINGKVAQLGNRVRPGDQVLVDGKPLQLNQKEVYIALYKPRGIVSTTDSKERKNIVKYVGHPERIFPIGRLDKDSEGLIVLTNNGDIVNKILRAGNEHEKEYLVWVDRGLSKDFKNKMEKGVPVLGSISKPCKVKILGPNQFKIILTEGKNRQIRRMCSYLGYKVTRLKRTRIMNINLGNLEYGKWRDLTAKELNTLLATLKNSSKTEEASR